MLLLLPPRQRARAFLLQAKPAPPPLPPMGEQEEKVVLHFPQRRLAPPLPVVGHKKLGGGDIEGKKVAASSSFVTFLCLGTRSMLQWGLGKCSNALKDKGFDCACS